jgi:hypothetical protein
MQIPPLRYGMTNLWEAFLDLQFVGQVLIVEARASGAGEPRRVRGMSSGFARDDGFNRMGQP